MAVSAKEWLQKKHKAIMAVEQEALALMKSGDIAGYNKKMREKADMLAELAEEAEKNFPDLDPQIKSSLEQFSMAAATSLEIGSVFFMSALLYPDEHKPGELDNLQKLIDTL